MNLQTRSLLIILGAVLLLFSAIFGTTSILSKNMTEKEAEKLAKSLATEQANRISLQLQSPLDSARTLAYTIESMKESNNISPDTYKNMLKSTLEKNKDFLGVWSVSEPNALGDKAIQTRYASDYDQAGRFSLFWARGDNGITTSRIEGTESMKETSDFDYYFLPKKSGKETIMNPYFYEIHGKKVLITSLIVPMFVHDQFIGVVGIDVSLDHLNELNSKLKVYDSGFGVLLSNNGTFVAHPNKDNIGKTIDDMKGLQNKEQLKHALKTGTGYTIMDYSPTAKTNLYKVTQPIPIGNTATPWAYVVAAPMNEVMADSNKIMTTNAIMAIVGVMILAVILVFITRNIVQPIKRTIEHCKKMANGDFSFEVSERSLRRKDEIKDLAIALIEIKTNIKNMLENIKETTDNVALSASQLKTNTDQGTHSANQLTVSVQKVANGAAIQEKSAEESVQAIEEMAIGIQRVAETASTIAEGSNEIISQVHQGNSSIQQSIQQMKSIQDATQKTASIVQTLNDDSKEIGQILQLITEVAAQTNLLALNAAIEAARAGEAGKGFAVVADEIRKLADQTGASADKISKLITKVQINTDQAVQSMDESKQNVQSGISVIHQVNEMFSTIMHVVENSSDQIQEMSAVSEQMSASTEEVTASVESMNHVAKQSADNTNQIVKSAEDQLAIMNDIQESASSLFKTAENLEQLMKQFKIS